jgi:serine/threonine-protein kinase
MALADGQLLDGKYVITRKIAEGGMSTVYLGVNQRLGKEVAVKVLSPAMAAADDVLERFEREARIVSRIHSPYVADVFDYGALETGERFMVMEYLEGESLAAMLERERTIPVRMLSTIAMQILEGLAAAHSVGIIHRDLKPENVIVTKRGKDLVVKLVDFGISKVLDGSGLTTSIGAAVRQTAAGAVLGTPLYMSPEQARGSTILIDQRTDLYSLGVIIYEATAGEPPLMGENVNDLLFRVALDEPTPLTTRVPSVDRGFAAIVAKAMAKTVTDRYQTADEMIAALEEWRAQFVSLPPITAFRESATITPVVLEPRNTTKTTGVYARARRYALAVPALALIVLLLPFAKSAVSPAPVPTVAAEPAAEATNEPLMPSTKLVPIATDPIIIERAVIPKWVSAVPLNEKTPKPKAPKVIDAGPPEPMITVEAPVDSNAAPNPQEENKEQGSAD